MPHPDKFYPKKLSKFTITYFLILSGFSFRCKQKVADAKLKRLTNIERQEKEQQDRLEAIREKLAAGIARRNLELRNRQLRSLTSCRWCAARRIQIWWVSYYVVL